MDHPLRSDAYKPLRQRVIQHLRNDYSVKRAGDIIFVCGGNDATDMRPRFHDYCKAHHPDLELFQPEYAMTDYFSGDDTQPFDISEFEELVGQLSHAIVLFPEKPGSFAEAGYFSLHPELASKTILVMDADRQGDDSFISMGPAKKIDERSVYRGVMQVAYGTPKFDQVVARARRRQIQRNRKELVLDAFGALSAYDLFCLIYKIVDLLGIATMDDILAVLRGLFKQHLKPTRAYKLASVLVGSKYLKRVGDFDHYRVVRARPNLLPIRDASKTKENEIRLELAALFMGADIGFRTILETPDAP